MAITFKKHKREFFNNRVGKIIFLHLSDGSIHPVVIKSTQHAKALYNYHRDNRLNYTENGKDENQQKETK